MAWRPTPYLIEGELDNTTPGRITGWLRFAGLADRITLDLTGNCHRDIRGAKIHITGDGDPADPAATQDMADCALHQTGHAGDITAGLPPVDYVAQPYIEWYSDQNGRIVIEPDVDQVQVVGRPIPAIESDPISRAEQARNMSRYLAQLSADTGIPVLLAGGANPPDDPNFTHWLVVDGVVNGEARDVQPNGTGSTATALVRLFGLSAPPARRRSVSRDRLVPKRPT
jgi:hypothetical protein